jgi:hypothetical protein
MFVRQWLGRQREDLITRVEAHLNANAEVGIIVRNPLLTTILCVLAENGIPLPESEVRLYEERMRLLLGHYDVHKQVARIKSQRGLLELLARRIAFYLHRNQKREEDRSRLYDVAQGNVADWVSGETARLAVDELLDPCNVLVPMSSDGKLGFGHLRYQEYLAALEILHDRSIDVVRYVSQAWWRGALVLFSKMSDNLEWFIGEVVEAMAVGRSYGNLMAMIESVPPRKRELYERLVSENLRLDEGAIQRLGGSEDVYADEEERLADESDA